jgi:hypothetical protein
MSKWRLKIGVEEKLSYTSDADRVLLACERDAICTGRTRSQLGVKRDIGKGEKAIKHMVSLNFCFWW